MSMVAGLLIGFAAVVAEPGFAQLNPGETSDEPSIVDDETNPGQSVTQSQAAQRTPPVKEYQDDVVKALVEGETNNAGLTDMTTRGTFLTFISASIGGSPEYEEVVGIGATEFLGSTIASLYGNPAASTDRYIADVLESANVVSPAYAQGIGFASLDVVLSAWKVFRNIAYLFFVVVFILIGFMIMFRQKINGQTVVTAQQAIPNIIISLLMVTFSYAIAGLLIDAMYVSMYLLLGLFGYAASDWSSFLDSNILNFGLRIVVGSAGNAAAALQGTLSDILSNTGLADVVATIPSLIGAAIFALAILYGIFRLFFELLKTYVNILLSVVLSPILLMMGAIPGRNPFMTWLKGLIGNLIAFPTVLLILIIYDMMTNGIVNSAQRVDPFTDGGGGFSPPYLFGFEGADAVAIFLGLGILLIMPDLVVQAKKAIGGGGGVFEQFANAVKDNLGKAYKGGELVPGMGMTDLRKLPGGGLTGENIRRKVDIGTATAAGGVYGAAEGVYRRRILGQTSTNWAEGAVNRGRKFGKFAANKLGDKELGDKNSK